MAAFLVWHWMYCAAIGATEVAMDIVGTCLNCYTASGSLLLNTAIGLVALCFAVSRGWRTSNRSPALRN